MNRLRPAAAALLLLIAAGCGIPQSLAPSPSSSPAPSSAPPPAPVRAGSPALVVTPVVLDPVVDGWTPVRSVKRAAAYDVPPSWFVHSESTVAGYQTKGGDLLAATGAADSGVGVCGDNASLALAAVKHDTGPDIELAATSSARDWADLAFRDDRDRPPKLSVGPPEPITTFTGGSAVVVRVTAKTAKSAGTCKITDGVVYAVSATDFTGELGPTVILVVVAVQGRPDQESEDEIRQILTTLRPI